ncbi:MAG: ZIP family metal transporter [Bacteroidales bacterium]|nr:ZIP family metal transporter [Bacteroidales bacterium]
MTLSTAAVGAYVILVGGVVLWSPLFLLRHKLSEQVLQAISLFGGAFLLASCFINLVPHMYLHGAETPLGFKIGVMVMAGFLLQLLIERLTHGAEHCHSSSSQSPDVNKVSLTGLMAGLCIHSFIEGMPLVDTGGDVHQGLLWGIVLHNIPIACILIGLMLDRHLSLIQSLLILLLFAVMAPLGSLTALCTLSTSETAMELLMGVVVGILLHIAVGILFSGDHHRITWAQLLLILIATAAAYLVPGCAELYG